MNNMDKIVDEILGYVTQLYGFNDTQKEIARYGIQGIFEIGINIIISLIIMYQMDMILEGMIFFLVFIPLRTFVGGFHLETYLGCLISSSVILIAVLEISSHVTIRASLCFICSFVLELMIWRTGMITNPNRPVSANEEKQILIRIKYTLIILQIISLIMLLLQSVRFLKVIMFCLCTILLSQLAGKLKYQRVS